MKTVRTFISVVSGMARKIILTLQPNLLAACLGLLVAARGVEAKYVVRTLEANLRVRLVNLDAQVGHGGHLRPNRLDSLRRHRGHRGKRERAAVRCSVRSIGETTTSCGERSCVRAWSALACLRPVAVSGGSTSSGRR